QMLVGVVNEGVILAVDELDPVRGNHELSRQDARVIDPDSDVTELDLDLAQGDIIEQDLVRGRIEVLSSRIVVERRGQPGRGKLKVHAVNGPDVFEDVLPATRRPTVGIILTQL